MDNANVRCQNQPKRITAPQPTDLIEKLLVGFGQNLNPLRIRQLLQDAHLAEH